MQRQVEAGGATRQTKQALRQAQRHDDRAPVEFTHTEVDQRGHAHRFTDRAGEQGQPVARTQAQVGRQFAADDGLAGREPGLAVDHLLAQPHHPVVTFQVHARQRDRLGGFAAQCQAATGHHWRDRGDGRHPVQLGQQRLPVGDRAQALRLGLRVGQRIGARLAGTRRRHAVVRRAQAHMRLAAQGLVEGIALQPGDQGRDIGDHRNTGGNADHDQDRLQPTLAQESHRNTDLETKPGVHRGRSLSVPWRW